MYLSVIIPQYNESANLHAGVLNSVAQFLAKQDFEWEVIVVDDGSTDDSLVITEGIVQGLKHFRVIKAKHGGKPAALMQGIKAAHGQFILLTDMDQSTPISEIHKLLPYLDQYQVVIGSRGKKRRQASLLRKTAGFIFGTYRRALILGEIADTQCGFKLFEANLLKQLFPKLSSLKKVNVAGWSVSAFDVELLFMYKKAGAKIQEVKVEWNDKDLSQTKDRKFIQESLDMLKQIFIIQANNIKGKYSSLIKN